MKDCTIINQTISTEVYMINGVETKIYYRNGTGDEGAIDQIIRQKQLDISSLNSFFIIEDRYKEIIEKSIPLILDCGSHIGLASIWFSTLFKEAAILSFEPNYGNFLVSKKNVENFCNITVLNDAISSDGSSMYTNDYDRGTMGFVAEKQKTSDSSMETPSQSINEIISSHSNLTPFIVKIDIEGGEEDLFSASTEWMDYFDVIIIELHDWLYPGKFISKNFWIESRKRNYDIECIGENIVLIKSTDSLTWLKTNDLLMKIYLSNSILSEWSDHLIHSRLQNQVEQERQRWSCSQSGLEETRTALQEAEEKNTALQNQIDQERARWSCSQSELVAVRSTLQDIQWQLDHTRGELDQLYRSRSWRITRPLRYTLRQIRQTRQLARNLRGLLRISNQPMAAATSQVVHIKQPPTKRIRPRPRVLPKAVAVASTGLRVLIVTPDIVGPIRNGGIGTAFAALALFAARAGARVSLLYTLGTHSEHWSMADCVAYYAQGAVHFIPLRPSAETPHIDAPWPRRNAYAVYTWLKSHGEDYDLIIFPEWHGEAYYTVLARHQGLMLQHAQIWVNTHGPSVWSMEGNYQLPSEIDLIDLDFMERETVRLADGIISPSAYLLDWMRGHQWQLPRQALVIQNLMEEKCVEDATTQFDVNIIDELIFFGRLEPRKGLIIFCDAIDRLTPTVRDQLRLITFMGKAILVDVFDSISYIEQRAAAWRIPIVIQTEYGREQALAYLTESPSRLAVITSLVENLPYTVLECLHHGIRFLATEVGGIPELIDSADHVRVLFPPRPAALARLLESAITEGLAPAHRAQMPEQVEAKWQTLFAQITANLRDKPAVPSITTDQMPLVSICIPHHDSPDTLRAALDSIRRQSYPHYEVIVVDDGSSDEQTLTALTALEKEFAQKGGVLIRQENAYPGAARNRAAATAKGEYLLFMDDDNLAMSHELEMFVAVAQRTNADILTTVSAVFTGKTPPERPKHLWLPLGAATGAGVYRNVFGDTNSFWKRSSFRAVGGFTEDYGVGHEDWEIFAKATLMGLHLELVPEPLFWYRVMVGGVQTAGDMAAYHARSARPYLQHDPHGLGMLAAHAAWARFSTAPLGSQPNSGKKVSFRKALSLIRRPDLYIKFRITIKRYGLKTAIRKSMRYLRNQS